MNNNITTIILDIDGTLSAEVSWLKLTEYLGASVEKHILIFDDFKINKIDYLTAKSLLVQLWQSTGNAIQEKMVAIFQEWDLKPDAQELVDYLKLKQYRLCIMSGSVDIYVQTVAEKLGISDYYANTELVFDNKGNLIDFHYYRNQAEKKLEHLRKYVSLHKITPAECAIIGNGDSDILLFKELGFGIAVETDLHEEVRNEADIIVRELREIKSFIGV